MADSKAKTGKIDDEPGTSYNARKQRNTQKTKGQEHVKGTQDLT